MREQTGAVSVVGLGKLGACMAACFAERGIRTIGLDVKANTVDLVNAGRPPVDEPGLAETMARAGERLRAVCDYRAAVRETDATFLVVPTPSEQHGGFSLRDVNQAGRELGRALREKSGYHLVVLTSTVLPGSTEYGLLPILEETSGKRCGEAFGLCYSPEFIALGSVIHDFLHPDFVLIGESDRQAGDLLEALYAHVSQNHPPVVRMNFVNAELTKVAVNTFMTMKITFANMLASLCERLPGGDVSEVTSGLALFGGVGPRGLSGGMGYGGPCLPRDNLALSYLARHIGHRVMLPELVDQYNRAMLKQLEDKVLRYAAGGDRVAVLGLAYKPFTSVIEESQGVGLARRLAEQGFAVAVYDPKAMEAVRELFGDRVAYASSADAAIHDASVVVITTPDPAFTSLSFRPARGGRKPVVIDGWRILRERLEHDQAVTYVPIGIGASSPMLTSQLAALWGAPMVGAPITDRSEALWR